MRIARLCTTSILAVRRGSGIAIATATWVGLVPPATAQRPALQSPAGLALDAAGNVFVADRAAHVVFRIDARTNAISVIAGTGTAGWSGDGGPARAALLRNPEWVELDAQGNLYVADRGNHVIRRIDAAGIITHVAGTGVQGQSGDGGPAATAAMTNPFGLTLDRTGNVFFFDTEVHAIRRIDARTGVVTTVVGNKQRGFSGDGGPATLAMLHRPHNGTFDRDGALIFGDSFNQRIRRWDPSTGIIETIAGTGEQGASPDGTPARQARFTAFGGIAVDRAGDLVITSLDHRILRLDRRAGVIRNFAGTGTAGFSGEGASATTAQFSTPYGIAIAPNGDVIVADAGNARIRRIDAATGVIRTIAGPGAWNTSALCAVSPRLAAAAPGTSDGSSGGSSRAASGGGEPLSGDSPRGAYRVGVKDATARDETRMCRVPADTGAQQQGVPLSIAYWYPAAGSASGAAAPIVDAPPASGAFPIVVGMGTTASSSVLAEHLASHGYIVALVRPTIEYDLGPAQRLDAYARDIDFALRYLSRLPFADTTRVATWGTGVAAVPALLAAIQTRGIDAAVSIAGTTFDPRHASALRETPLRDPGAVRVPLLHMTHASDGRAPEPPAGLRALRYSERFHVVLGDTSSARADYVRRFLDAYLRQDAGAAAWLARSPEENGMAPSAVTVARYSARPPAPSAQELVTLIRGESVPTAMARFHELRRSDPEAGLFQEATINAIGYQLLPVNPSLAIEMFKVNTELHPRSTNTWDSLSEAYETTGDTARAIELAQKALDVATTDTSVTTERRAELRRIASDRVRRLRGGATSPQRH